MPSKRISGIRRQWRSEELAGLKPTVYDWVRIAAFIDGEGHLDINHCNNWKRSDVTRVIISNTHAGLPTWLVRTFGGTITMRVHKNPKWKAQYIWSCASARAAWIIHNALPWLIIKHEQGKLLLELQDELDQTKQSRNHRGITAESFALRERISADLKKLNAKGPEHQVLVSIEEMTRG